ncbi:hypothetical protein QBC47DRAFT_384594 [Echria macrotheca]|uniref:Small ribosomal subunit protein bS18m n=1 Tax=Echria macrotheca TaxID=438768 RepID=A0AAJ0BF22_9PEZI|nr:hypothetical protein QBC47DRAFT_384594 [Echria macrotheca]
MASLTSSSSRQWLSTAARQCRAIFHQQQQPQRLLSTTAATASFRKIPTDNKSPSASLASLDEDPIKGISSWVSATQNTARLRASASSPNSPNSRTERMQLARDDLAASAKTDSYVRFITRRWRKGDVYAPRDLSAVEMRRWKKTNPPGLDAVDALGFDPVDNYRNFALVSEYMTSAGRIRHHQNTGLRPVNQRKMAKAVRRAIGLGIHPSVHLHPQILLAHSRFHAHGVLPTTAKPPSKNGFGF